MKNICTKITVVAASLLAASSAFAIPTLTISSGTSSFSFSSTSPIFSTPANLAVGSWKILGQASVVYDGSVSQPFWDLDIDAQKLTAGGQSLTVSFSYDGPSSTVPSILFAQDGGSLLGAGRGFTITDTVLLNGNPLLTINGLPGPGGALTANFHPHGNYTLSEVLTITAPNGVESVSSDSAAQVTVPDAGSTMILLGSALTGLGLFTGFRKQNR